MDEARGILFRIQTAADSQVIHTELKNVKELLQRLGNPVWIFSN